MCKVLKISTNSQSGCNSTPTIYIIINIINENNDSPHANLLSRYSSIIITLTIWIKKLYIKRIELLTPNEPNKHNSNNYIESIFLEKNCI